MWTASLIHLVLLSDSLSKMVEQLASIMVIGYGTCVVLHEHKYSNCDIVVKLFYTKPRQCIQIYVLHQMSAQYKNINNTKLDKSILCNKSCDNDKVNLGQVRFLRT